MLPSIISIKKYTVQSVHTYHTCCDLMRKAENEPGHQDRRQYLQDSEDSEGCHPGNPGIAKYAKYAK